MKMRIFITAAYIAAIFMLPVFSLTARAEPDELPAPEVVDIITEILPVLPDGLVSTEVSIPTDEPYIPVTDIEIQPPRPFTPSGTGTVVNNATDGDGKEFYTITTPDGHVFYLVIDRQRNTENVYFLNAVTVVDLMSLAEIPVQPAPTPVMAEPVHVSNVPEPEPTPAPPSEPDNGNAGMIVLIVAVIVIGGGAGWYFKIYRPKQQGAGREEEYEPPAPNYDEDFSDDWEDGQADADYETQWSDYDDTNEDEEEE